MVQFFTLALVSTEDGSRQTGFPTPSCRLYQQLQPAVCVFIIVMTIIIPLQVWFRIFGVASLFPHFINAC